MWLIALVCLLASIGGGVACLILHFATYFGIVVTFGGLDTGPFLGLFYGLFPIGLAMVIAGARYGFIHDLKIWPGLPRWARIILEISLLYFLATFAYFVVLSQSSHPPSDLAAYETRGLTGVMFEGYHLFTYGMSRWFRISIRRP